MLAAFYTVFATTVSFAAEGEPISSARLLSASDIGKVFVQVDQEPHPNFGKYLVLTRVDELYGFDTFDLTDKGPIGKLHVSYFPAPLYREVAISPRTLELARAAIKRFNDAFFKRMEIERLNAPPNKSLGRTREG
jgi:hypothetical protein